MAATLTLIRSQPVAGNVSTFVFEPDRPLEWTAGQFIRVELPHAPADNEGTKRYFTIASAPSTGRVHITTRLTTSSFKQALAALRAGQTLRLLDQPAGDFVWPARAGHPPLIFAAQGIGVTPFYSMLTDRLHHHLPIGATLLFANRSPGIPFQAELAGWAATHPEFRLVLTSGRLTAAAIGGLVPNLAGHLVYASGPGNLIELLGPPYNLPGNQLKQDFFPNYSASSY
jgi:glycine betaine catabolism B